MSVADEFDFVWFAQKLDLKSMRNNNRNKQSDAQLQNYEV